MTFVTSKDFPPESYHDKTAPLAGSAGIEDAIKKGILRKATNADMDAWIKATEKTKPPKDTPPVAGQGVTKTRKSPFRYGDTYVVLRAFVYPAGLYGLPPIHFIISKGVPMPKGKSGPASVYDFNTLTCKGPMCNMGEE
jgi:hypothetical protein